VAGSSRLIGNVLVDCGDGRTMVGFENHAGRTWIGDGVAPLGRVIAGAGNNGEDRTEGCRAERILGTYVHGPLLPKNPWIADELLQHALDRRGGGRLEPLDDGLEAQTAEGAAAIARSERR
jgi:CobQ-like glutamine amidotransferase family enzyme